MSIINRDNDETLSDQLTSYYRVKILDGSLPAGTRLPTELELAEKYSISRGTVRQAMTALVSEGLLDRVQGRGTFVRPISERANHSKEKLPESKRIGLLLSYAGSELDLDILRGVEYAAKSRGYQVSFAYTEESAEQQTHDINHLLADGVAGLIIYPLSDITYDEAIWGLKAKGIPFVLIDRYFPDLDSDYVVSDNFGGAYRSTEHLIILGHSRIGFCYWHLGTFATTSVRDRLNGYRRALEEYGLPFDETLLCKRTKSSNGESDAYIDFLSQPNRPDAIVASHDNEALQILKAAQQLDLDIPEDLALVGFDNLRLTAHTHPLLTTVSQSCRDIGLRAVEIIIQRIEGHGGNVRHVEVPTNLVVRESCGAKKHIRTTLKE
ncbi:MAG: GntR family transcriptional regulator [Anaerolineae bacterium]|nr:GntR family transcriptional regulator [Anaerolineae bacterium]